MLTSNTFPHFPADKKIEWDLVGDVQRKSEKMFVFKIRKRTLKYRRDSVEKYSEIHHLVTCSNWEQPTF